MSTVVGAPEITPVVLLTESPSGSDGAHTSTSSWPEKVGVMETDSPLVTISSVVSYSITAYCRVSHTPSPLASAGWNVYEGSSRDPL